jgi:hypothetical protein
MRLTVEPSSRNTNKKPIKLKTFTYWCYSLTPKG